MDDSNIDFWGGSSSCMLSKQEQSSIELVRVQDIIFNQKKQQQLQANAETFITVNITILPLHSHKSHATK